ncbi:MAG TPA: molybdopterin-binding/glycosyltransferase family 2 protein [Azospirillaceae bacterium]|nr:molybdopterin-binding/glycosyltransferase family 2 protein [Azospirillaceae bacterium]
MYFGPIPVDEAEGAILAHLLRLGAQTFRKGRVLDAADVSALRAASLATVVGARLEAGDIGEDAAASRVGQAVMGDGLTASAAFTGRVNLFAAAAGLTVIDTDVINRLNLLDESVTIATLPPFTPVEPRQMVATIKIIPFAAPAKVIERIEVLAAGEPPVRVAPFRPFRAGLVQTRLPGTKEGMLDKTVAATEERLAQLGGTLAVEWRCDHAADLVAVAVADQRARGVDVALVIGASAITDRRDVLPAGIVAAGGEIEHYGMPVDPGNLMLLARLRGMPVLGLPGCARSPKLNGFDWVLQRFAAGIPVSRADVMRMGVGGLLTEIPSRPQPRAASASAPAQPRIAAVVLAAGLSSRMGEANKLLMTVDGVPMVARAVDAALASQARPVVVVTGHDREAVAAVLGARPVTLVHNPDYGRGISASLRAGIAALPQEVDGVLVCLGDMPFVAPPTLNRLIAAYAPAEGRAVCVPTVAGRRGNPVLWDRRFFAAMAGLSGDSGARALLHSHADLVCEVPVDDQGVLLDFDTPEAFGREGRPDGP